MPWILNIAYAIFLLAVSPVLFLRVIVQGKYRDGWGEKLFGRLPRPTSQRPRLWFHAVSVGEVLQLETVLDALRKQRADVEFVVTTTTRTGLAVAREKFPQDVVCYFPLDFSWAVRRAIHRIDPAAIVLVELELWPNFIFSAHRTGIPLSLINGRISEKSFRGYRRIRPIMRRLLGCFRLLAVQNDMYRDRLLKLGAPAKCVTVTGSIKFDRVETDRQNAKTKKLGEAFGLAADQSVFLAGSTQHPEEEYALLCWQSLRNDFPDLRLILVPRHKERFEQVAHMVKSKGLPLLRRSSLLNQRNQGERDRSASRSEPPPVLLLDTLGELSSCWGLADIAFVGGSLTNRGGQNMIEPAAFGAAVLFGPNTRNFRDVVEMLLSHEAACVVADKRELLETVRRFLVEPETARKQGRIAQKLVLTQQGATTRTIHLLIDLLPDQTIVRAA